MLSVRSLLVSEVDVAAATLAAAFDDDPLFRFLLPDGQARPRWLRWFQAHALREALSCGGAMTLAGGPSLGAIGFFPADTWPPPVRSSIGALRLPPGLPPFVFARWGLHLEHRIRGLHPIVKHIYIYVLGVQPREKGRGFGGALLRAACAQADDASVVAHLETANPVNLPLYRHFGFEIVDEITSHGGPPVWTMTRSRAS